MDTVALILAPNTPAIIVPFEEAWELYQRYAELTLTRDSDRQLFAALTTALNPMPKPALAYSAGEPSVADKKIAEWKARSDAAL